MSNEELSKGRKIQLPKLHQKVEVAKQPSADPNIMPNRIGLMVDLSSSMNEIASEKPKIDHLKDALCGFIQNSNPTDTAIAIESFPLPLEKSDEDRDSDEELDYFTKPREQNANGFSRSLTNLTKVLVAEAQMLQAAGNTPMGFAMERMLHRHPITHAVIISDGEATDYDKSDIVCNDYVSAGVKIDCVHIGESTKGEARLKAIAERTGGMYIKFTDVSKFGQAFKFLNPGFRGMLAQYSEEETAKLLGASEVKK